MSSNGQVSIDMDNLNKTKNQKESLNASSIEVDGSHSNRHRSHGEQRDHHSPKENNRRHRRRSRSHSPSPSRRNRRSTETNTPPTEKDLTTNVRDVEPLLITETAHKIKHTELEDDSDENNIPQIEQNPGVDDGFFIGTRADNPDDADNRNNSNDNPNINHNNIPNETHPTFPFAPGFNPNVILDAAGNPQVIPDINVYQQKKNLAQGMMDLALLSANANQLRYVLESYVRHPYYWFSLISISISLILQVAVGVGLILNSRYNVKNKEQICRADKINNFTIIGIFLITAVNVFIAAFGVADAPTTT